MVKEKESAPAASSTEPASTADATATATTPPTDKAEYNPNQVVRLSSIQDILNLLVHPVWIFDYVGRKTRWANDAAVELFDASSNEELCARDFSDMSDAVVKRNQELLARCESGLRTVAQWTFYPKGKAKTVRINVRGIRLQEDAPSGCCHPLPHVCFFVEGIPIEHKEIDNEVLRGVEMLRHLPMAVCQFDMEGKVMFQNPEASIFLNNDSNNKEIDNEDDDNEGSDPNVAGTRDEAISNDDNTAKKREDALDEHNDDDREQMEDATLSTVASNCDCSEHSEPQHSRTMKDNGLANSSSTTTSDPPSVDNHEANEAESINEDPNQSASAHRKRSAEAPEAPQTMDNTTTDSDTTDLDPADHHPKSSNKSSNKSARKRKKADGGLLCRFVEEQVGLQILQQVRSAPKETTMEFEAMLHTQKGPTWSSIQIRQATDPVTSQAVLLYSAQDKSDAVEAQKERKARQHTSEFLAIMAHEIRTPLHQVTGFVDLLDQTQGLDKEQKGFVHVLKSSAQLLMSVINDVLDYSKLEAGKMKLEKIPYEPLSVVKASIEAVRASCEERKLYLNLDWDKTIPFKLKSDPNRLRQILCNLLNNAVKFTKKGGITVSVTYQQKGDKPTVKFAIIDTGIGISQEHQQIIFEKYQQANITVARNYGGTGLGLSICNLLSQMMGGTMGVDSQGQGHGATFWFVLPAEEPTEKELAGDVEEDEDTLPSLPTSNSLNGNSAIKDTTNVGSLNILVAEDNKVNQKLVVNMLKRMGYTSVSVAENGKEAIDMIVEARDMRYDLCLMDIQMPVMDGLEATKRLRSMGYSSLLIYGLTASVARSDFVELGFDDWLPKPIRMKDLKLKLNHLKQQQQQQSQ